MNKKAHTQKRLERYIVRDFLDHAGISYVVHGIRSVREGMRPNGKHVAGPDVSITCELPGGPKRVGIEVVEYQNDVGSGMGGSGGRRAEASFRHIWECLRRRLHSRPSIREVHGWLVLDRDHLPQMAQCGAIADELIRFIETNRAILSDEEPHWFDRPDERGRGPDFRGSPLLTTHFKKLRLHLWAGLVGPFRWDYDSASSVGVVKKTVIDIIDSKASKLPAYDKSNTDETWLLICAGLALPTDSAGPRQHGQRYLADAEIRCAAAQSGFDKVIFWERVHGWHEHLT